MNNAQEDKILGENHEMTWRKISYMCKDILDQEGDIENKYVVKNMIDFCFEAYSKKVLIFHICLYVLFYFLPFLLQIHTDAQTLEG